MNVIEAAECALNNGVIRCMIMRKSRGISLHRFRQRFSNWVVPMDIAAEITKSVIHGLERLHHEVRLVHGDIHSGNILLEESAMTGQLRILFMGCQPTDQ